MCAKRRTASTSQLQIVGAPASQDSTPQPPQRKVSPWTDLRNWMTHNDASYVVPVHIPAKEVFAYSDADLNACVMCDIIFNDIITGHALKATHAGAAAKSFALFKGLPSSTQTQNYNNMSYGDLGPTLEAAEWQEIRSRHPELKTTDKAFMLQLYTREELDALRGVMPIHVDRDARDLYKTTFGEEATSPVGPQTRGELYQQIMKNLQFGCQNCPSCKLDNTMSQYVVADITASTASAPLDQIQILFLGEAPATEEIKNRIPFIGRSGDVLRGALQQNNIPLDRVLIANTCFCFHAPGNKPTNDEMYKCFPHVETIIKSLPLLKVIVPIGGTAMSRLGIVGPVLGNTGKLARYNSILVYPVPHPSWLLRTGKGIPEMAEFLRGVLPLLSERTVKRVSRERQFTDADVISILSSSASIQQDEETTMLPASNDITSDMSAITSLYSTPVVNYAPPQVYDIEQVRRAIGDGMAVVGVGSSSNSFAPGYICFRKGDIKQFYYINPMVEFYAPSYARGDLLAIEPKSSMSGKMCSYDKLRGAVTRLNRENIRTYNSDYSLSTYALTQLKTQLGYAEDESVLPRIWYLDIETEMDAIRVTSDSTNVRAKLRLVSFFDTYEKAFHVMIVNSDQNRGHDVDIDAVSTTFNEKVASFPVYINRVETDYEAILWLQNKLIELDPDLITGWNVEMFDMIFLIKRAQTLGITLSNKYGPFSIVTTKREKRVLTFVQCDGIAILDYLVLYRSQILKKRENYKLDYIAELELGPDKKKDALAHDHDTMYHQHLKEYVHYNIVDNLRVYELECKLNYIAFNAELCRICNIGWADIFSKIRLIDGIVYQFTLERNLVVTQRMKAFDEMHRLPTDDVPEESDSYVGASVLDPQPGLYEGTVDLDATSLYPTIMIRYNLLCDTYVGSIDPEVAVAYLYNPTALPTTFKFISASGQECETNAESLRAFLSDKILIAEGMVYLKPENRSSIISEILMYLIGQRAHYRNLLRSAKQEHNTYLSDRYEVLQYAYKQLANSIYGVMGTSVYRLSDKITASAITGAGRELIRLCAHFASKYIQKIIDDRRLDIPYDVFDMTVPSIEELAEIAQRKYVIYGDSVVGDTTILVQQNSQISIVRIDELFYRVDYEAADGKEYCYLEDVKSLTKDEDGDLAFRPILYVMRHRRGKKKLIDVIVHPDQCVTVTEDHSLMWTDPAIGCDVCGTPAFGEKQTDLFLTTVDVHVYKTDPYAYWLKRPTSMNESSRDDEYVYDIEVEDTHTFFANGVLVHNTDSLFINIMPAVEAVYPDLIDKTEKFQKAWEIIGHIGDYINKHIVIELLKRKGINPEDSMKDHNFNFKQEIVMATSIFFNVKKQYAYRAIMDKGVAVNERVIKGHEAQKSDTPRAIRGALSEMINYLLDSYDPTHVVESQAGLLAIYNKYHTEYDRLLTDGNVLAARPVSVSQEFEEFVTAAATLKGMLLYTLLYGHEFRVGNKGYLFYIKHVNFDAFNTNAVILLDQAKSRYSNYPWMAKMTELACDVVVVPQEVDRLDTRIFTVNKEHMLTNFLQKRAEKIFNVVHMGVPGVAKPLVESLMVWDSTNDMTQQRTSSKKQTAKKVTSSIRVCI